MKYKFKTTGNKQIDKIILQFDKQIQEEYKLNNGVKERCPSYWYKLIFLETINLDINDWRKIRSGDYWKIHDSVEGIQRSKFILRRIRKYLE